MSATPDALVSEEVEDELAHRRFDLMARQAAAVGPSFLMIVFVVAGIAATAVPLPVVFGWAVMLTLTQLLRVRWLKQHGSRRELSSRTKLRTCIAWNLTLGLLFGASASFMYWLGGVPSAVLTTILVSTAAGAVAISGPVLPVYMAYTLGIMLPYAGAWLSRGDWLGSGLALLMVGFIGVQLRFARQVAGIFRESFLIRRTNEELVRQLTAARDEADAANRAKTRFLAAASHDLRQPLHALSLQSSALLLDPRAEDAPQIASAIAESIEDVSSLLDSLLDISKLDAGTLAAEKRPIYLSRLVETLARSCKPWVEARGLTFEARIAPDLIAVTDPLLLERVLRNLIDNAIKFTPHGSITLSLVAGEEGLQLSVADTGVGIPAEAQSQVFQEFFQIDPRADTHARGLGLGLSIVLRIARLLDITLGLDSVPGQGTVVRLGLPLPHEPASLPVNDRAPSEGTIAGLRVLVLDDEEAIRAGMAALLKRLGCDVRTAADAAEAHDAAHAFAPQVLIVDYRLGDHANGIEAAGRMRDEHPELLALLVTGDTAPDRLREARDSGLEVLHKPVSFEQLKRTLTRLVAPVA